MGDSKYGQISEEEANKMLDEILEEDEEGNVDDDDTEWCPACRADEDLLDQKKICKCMLIAENSSRFSLRVMEAMRWLQSGEDTPLPTSTVEDIVDYIEANYRDDGDLYAQVRTALKQVCSEGFAVELLKNEYHFIGPDAGWMNRTTCSNDRCNCLQSFRVESPSKRNQRRSKIREDNCDCETSTIDKSVSRGKRRKVNEKRNTVSEDTPECSCSLILTDENENRCVCPDEPLEETGQFQRDSMKNKHGKRRSNSQRKNKAIEHDRLIASTPTMQHNMEKGRENNKKNSARMFNDIYQEILGQDRSKRSKQRNNDLKRWIKRCQKECEEQGKQRIMDN